MDFVVVIVCIVASAAFSAIEIAFFSISELKLRALAETGHGGARMGLRLRANPQRLLSTVLIGNNVANIAAASLVTLIALRLFGSEAVALATGLLTLLILIFGEIVPKTLAARHAAAVVQWLAYPIYWFEKLLWPILFILEPLILRLTGGRGLAVPFVTEEELTMALEESGRAGVLETDEVKMIKNVFQLNDITAEDAMTPRIYMFALDGGLTLRAAKEQLFSSQYSRIPVFDGSLDNITGILYKTTALKELAEGRFDVKLADIASPPLFVPCGKPADDLMKQFQQEKRHMAVVVNEFGGVMGLVTLEDLLEEVVGEIMDETDITEELIKRIGKNQILVHGRTEVRRINDFLKVDLGDDANTVSGLIQDHLGRIPAVGEEVHIGHCRLVVHEADPKSIKSVAIFKEEKTVVPAESKRISLSG
ncbi:MAG: HlyC/CorC family transporter [Deltaproteobacteria bacterium]|nr:HlyC/CorC family transporter [Deltaproteobacteria bacterium]